MNRPFRALPQAPSNLPKEQPSPVVPAITTPARRSLLGGLAAIAAAPAVAVASPLRAVRMEWDTTIPPASDVVLTAEELAARTQINPDAELIHICAAHPAAIHAVNHRSDEDAADNWQAYERSRDAIHNAKPVTRAGMLAKARAAKAEARTRNGGEDPDNCPAEIWAWDLVNDLLRLEGEA